MKRPILFTHSAGQQGPGMGSHDLVVLLRNSLKEWNIYAPVIERPESPDFEQWNKAIIDSFAKAKGPWLLIGHSFGGTALLKYLIDKKPSVQIDGLFLIAVPDWRAPDWDADEYILPEKYAEMLPKIPSIYLYYSEDDETVPISHLSFYLKTLKNAIGRKVKGYSHEFKSGLPELVKDVSGLSLTL